MAAAGDEGQSHCGGRGGLIRVGIDTGGTFTDVAVYDEGGLRVAKVPTTPRDPSQASADGLAGQLQDVEPVAILGHGTTIATNALLQQALPACALITTQGFADVVDIGRQRRLGLYDLDPRKPNVPVRSELRFEVRERVDAEGRVIEALDVAALEPIADALESAAERGLAAVAIGFLHAYRNPQHEVMAERYLRDRLGDQLVICRSSAVLPEFREYERFSSTVLNAALTPILGPYLGRLRRRIKDRHPPGVGDLLITQSDGTLLPAEEMAALPIRSVLSGPASGVIGAQGVMEAVGEANYVTLDMGGTSTDICAVQDREPLRRAEVEIGGYLVRTPALDIHTIGAGGGSVARLDAGGHLQVGPRSAGAVPGPVSYGRGGSEPTVTDATVALGHLPSGNRLAGSVPLDRDAAVASLRPLADGLDLSVEETAAGILAVQVSQIERAVRTLVAGRGIDVRDYALCVFGGAGPLLGSQVARALGARELVIPPHPGLLCAIGLLVADLSRVFSETRKLPLDVEGWREGRRILERLQTRAREWHRGSELPVAALRLDHSVDMRYTGQNHEIAVPIPDPDEEDERALRHAFEERHRALYRFTLERPADFVTWRVTAVLSPPGYRAPGWDGGGAEPGTARVYLDGGWRDAQMGQRDDLAVRAGLSGPAVIQQMDSTVLLLDGDEGVVDAYGNLRIRRTR